MEEEEEPKVFVVNVIDMKRFVVFVNGIILISIAEELWCS